MTAEPQIMSNDLDVEMTAEPQIMSNESDLGDADDLTMCIWLPAAPFGFRLHLVSSMRSTAMQTISYNNQHTSNLTGYIYCTKQQKHKKGTYFINSRVYQLTVSSKI
jgi:hypothetical protein